MLDVSSLELTMAKTKNRDYNKIIMICKYSVVYQESNQ